MKRTNWTNCFAIRLTICSCQSKEGQPDKDMREREIEEEEVKKKKIKNGIRITISLVCK